MNTTPRIFFTSDIHFGHANIIAYSNRPFGTDDERVMWNDKVNPVPQARKSELVREMNEAMVNTINDTVGPNDTLYILGDVSFAKPEVTASLVKRIKCKKILIKGNHDPDTPEFDALFDEVHTFLERNFQISGQKVKIVMCHYALRVWNKSHHGSLHLYGHSHGSLPDAGNRSMDVGMDAVGMRPISLEEVYNAIGTRSLKSEDHHVEPR